MKKRGLIIALVAAMMLSMAACGDKAKSASDIDAVVTEGSLTLDLPEGFAKDEDSSSEDVDMYTAGQDVASNINITTTANDGSFGQVTPEMLIESTEDQIAQYYGVEVDIELLEKEEYTINGCNALSYSFEYELSGVPLKQRQVIVEAPDTYYFVTFTDMNGEGYFEAFDAAADTIRFE